MARGGGVGEVVAAVRTVCTTETGAAFDRDHWSRGHVYISSPLLTVVGAVGLQVSDDVGLIERTGGFVELVVAVGTLATGED